MSRFRHRNPSDEEDWDEERQPELPICRSCKAAIPYGNYCPGCLYDIYGEPPEAPGFEHRRNPTYIDSLGVRVQDVPELNLKGIDAGIADVIRILNIHGFKTFQSASGLHADYQSRRPWTTGYISFLKEGESKNPPSVLEEIRRVAQSCGFQVDDSKTFFIPSLRVGTCVMQNGVLEGDLREQANKAACLHLGFAPVRRYSEFVGSDYSWGLPENARNNTEIFMKWLTDRDRRLHDLIHENGGYVDDDQVKVLWTCLVHGLTEETPIFPEDVE